MFYIKFEPPSLTIAVFLGKNAKFKRKEPKNASYKAQNWRLGHQSQRMGFRNPFP